MTIASRLWGWALLELSSIFWPFAHKSVPYDCPSSVCLPLATQQLYPPPTPRLLFHCSNGIYYLLFIFLENAVRNVVENDRYPARITKPQRFIIMGPVEKKAIAPQHHSTTSSHCGAKSLISGFFLLLLGIVNCWIAALLDCFKSEFELFFTCGSNKLINCLTFQN